MRKMILVLAALLASSANGQILAPILSGLNATGGGGPTPTLISSTTVDPAFNTSGTSSAINTTGGHLLVATEIGFNAGGACPTDNKGNTLTGLTQYGPTGSTASIQICYACNATVGTGHTFTQPGGTSSFTTLIVEAWSVVGASSGCLVSGTDHGFCCNSTSPVSATPTAANQVAITATGCQLCGSQTLSVSVGNVDVNDTAGTCGGGMGSYVTPNTSAVGPAVWTYGGGANEKVKAIAIFQ